MPEQPLLGEFDLLLLLTVLRLGDEAYGVTISRELAQLRGRDVSVGSIYAALERLETRGAVTSRLGEATPERGGRAKRFFRVTHAGLRSLHDTRRLLTSLWSTLPALRKEPA